MTMQTVSVPDLGGANDVDVIEVCVEIGDVVEVEQSIVVLETDKATMEIPCPVSGKVTAIHVADGSKLNEGDPLIDVEVAGEAAQESSEPAPEADVAQAAPVEVASAQATPSVDVQAASEQDVLVPDLGGAENVDIIEVCVAVGDDIGEGDSLVVVETDKASMEIPATVSGKLLSLEVVEGGKLNQGDVIAKMLVAGASVEPVATEVAAPAPSATQNQPAAKLAPAPTPAAAQAPVIAGDTKQYAGPAARQLARQLGVDLNKINASGPRGRLSKSDVRSHAKAIIEEVSSGKLSSGAGIPAIPEVDFSQFGDITLEPMSKIAKLTAANMSRNWLNVPHVTQFDDADITELEVFRKGMKAEAEKRGSKLTPMPFLIKAVAATLRAEPSFNASLHADGEHIVKKDYVNIGIAADTPRGLLVPVIKDADKKGLWEIADEVNELIGKARAGKLMPRDMQGSCFTISSLGSMGGKGFTPIVNAPEVAILGVSKASIQPVWDGKEFQPRQMLPLSLSYDHRAINGADCGRFFTHLVSVLSEIRKLLL